LWLVAEEGNNGLVPWQKRGLVSCEVRISMKLWVLLSLIFNRSSENLTMVGHGNLIEMQEISGF
jgi:hypothetical protein